MDDSTKDQVKGRVEQAAGDLTGDDDMRRRGKVDETKGKVKDAIDNVADKITGRDRDRA